MLKKRDYYNRKALFDTGGDYLIIPYDKHVIYADTDSIFTDIAMDVSEYNKTIDDIAKGIMNDTKSESYQNH